ncbi:hypothetical protein WA158_007462 [Blastocystis sp. Blastoise]
MPYNYSRTQKRGLNTKQIFMLWTMLFFIAFCGFFVLGFRLIIQSSRNVHNKPVLAQQVQDYSNNDELKKQIQDSAVLLQKIREEKQNKKLELEKKRARLQQLMKQNSDLSKNMVENRYEDEMINKESFDDVNDDENEINTDKKSKKHDQIRPGNELNSLLNDDDDDEDTTDDDFISLKQKNKNKKQDSSISTNSDNDNQQNHLETINSFSLKKLQKELEEQIQKDIKQNNYKESDLRLLNHKIVRKHKTITLDQYTGEKDINTIISNLPKVYVNGRETDLKNKNNEMSNEKNNENNNEKNNENTSKDNRVKNKDITNNDQNDDENMHVNMKENKQEKEENIQNSNTQEEEEEDVNQAEKVDNNLVDPLRPFQKRPNPLSTQSSNDSNNDIDNVSDDNNNVNDDNNNVSDDNINNDNVNDNNNNNNDDNNNINDNNNSIDNQSNKEEENPIKESNDNSIQTTELNDRSHSKVSSSPSVATTTNVAIPSPSPVPTTIVTPATTIILTPSPSPSSTTTTTVSEDSTANNNLHVSPITDSSLLSTKSTKKEYSFTTTIQIVKPSQNENKDAKIIDQDTINNKMQIKPKSRYNYTIKYPTHTSTVTTTISTDINNTTSSNTIPSIPISINNDTVVPLVIKVPSIITSIPIETQKEVKKIIQQERVDTVPPLKRKPVNVFELPPEEEEEDNNNNNNNNDDDGEEEENKERKEEENKERKEEEETNESLNIVAKNKESESSDKTIVEKTYLNDDHYEKREKQEDNNYIIDTNSSSTTGETKENQNNVLSKSESSITKSSENDNEKLIEKNSPSNLNENKVGNENNNDIHHSDEAINKMK